MLVVCGWFGFNLYLFVKVGWVAYWSLGITVDFLFCIYFVYSCCLPFSRRVLVPICVWGWACSCDLCDGLYLR